VLLYSLISEVDLIRACAESNDSAAWEELISRFRRAISLSIIRTAYQWGQSPERVVDDLVQETYLTLCANRCRLLLEFAVQHPEAILGYVKTIAVNVAHDHFKALHCKKRGSGEINQIIEDAEPRADICGPGGQAAMERKVLLGQISQCLASCSQGPDQDRDCMIFWLYYQQGMSAKDIAALPTIGLSAKGVESAILRLTRLVRERLVSMKSQTGSKSTPGEKGFLPAESY
jgi:RNA polymerase sigma-70 factor, ECF subfamily